MVQVEVRKSSEILDTLVLRAYYLHELYILKVIYQELYWCQRFFICLFVFHNNGLLEFGI